LNIGQEFKAVVIFIVFWGKCRDIALKLTIFASLYIFQCMMSLFSQLELHNLLVEKYSEL